MATPTEEDIREIMGLLPKRLQKKLEVAMEALDEPHQKLANAILDEYAVGNWEFHDFNRVDKKDFAKFLQLKMLELKIG